MKRLTDGNSVGGEIFFFENGTKNEQNKSLDSMKKLTDGNSNSMESEQGHSPCQSCPRHRIIEFVFSFVFVYILVFVFVFVFHIQWEVSEVIHLNKASPSSGYLPETGNF